MIDEILFGLNFGSLILIIIAIFLIIRSKRFENEKANDVINLILMGMFFIAVVIAFDSLLSAGIFNAVDDFIDALPVNSLLIGIELMIIPIAALTFLLGLIHLREINQ
ncbi:hypothetical protein HYX15_04095 [Candidatus Woesearchaeota archaeon]|nr:hypothetical protein [Candidatus Woesearchaeota archaeon]